MVAVIGRNDDLACGVVGRGPAVGVEVSVAIEFEQTAMPLVGSRLGDHRDHSGGKLAVLRTECAGLYAKFFHSVRIRRRVAVVTHLGDVVAAVKIARYTCAAAVDGAVDLDIFDIQPGSGGWRAGGVRGGAVVIGHHAGR